MGSSTRKAFMDFPLEETLPYSSCCLFSVLAVVQL